MSRTLKVVVLMVLSALFAPQLVRGQDARVTASGDDLHYLGYVMLTGDTLAWANIKSNDIFYLTKGLYFRKAPLLNYIQDDNLYFFGNALVTANSAELQKITDDNWFYLGSAMFEKTTAYLENVTDDDVYYFGMAMVKRELAQLNELSSEKQ